MFKWVLTLSLLFSPLLHAANQCEKSYFSEAYKNRSLPVLTHQERESSSYRDFLKLTTLLLRQDPRTQTPETIWPVYSLGHSHIKDHREGVGRAWLEIRNYYRKVEALAVGENKERLKSVRMSMFPHHTKESDALLTRVLQDKKTILPAEKIKTQIEYERRINVKSLPTEVTVRMHGSSWKESVTSAEELIQYMYLTRNANRDIAIPLSLAPLGSLNAHFHNDHTKIVTKQNSDNIQAAKYTKTLQFNFDRNDENKFQYKIIVSHQNETSVYYDTPNRDLQSLKRAVRIKSWTSPLTGETTARSAFMKETLDNQNSFWTQRDERYQHLDLKDTSRDLEAIKEILAGSIGESSKTLELTPIVTVKTQRYGFDVLWHEFKIGFITIDQFTRSNSTRKTLQWEVELLPEWYPLYNANRELFDSYFKELEKDFNGQPTTQPKYLQTDEFTTDGI